MTDAQLHTVIKNKVVFLSVTLLGVELPQPLQLNIHFRKLHLLIQSFIILQRTLTCLITQSLKENHSGRETGLIDTGPLVCGFILG